MSHAPVQDAVLAALRRGHPLTAAQIAGRTGCLRPSVSFALRALAEAGAVKAVGKEAGLRQDYGAATVWAVVRPEAP